MIRIAIVIAVGGGLGLLVSLWVLQDRMIYLPSGDVPDPAEVGLPQAETVGMTTADGVDLAGWYVPASSDPVGAVLVLPGNAGNRAGRAPLAAALGEMGLATLLLDYRGYGGNPGRPSQAGVLADARAGVEALARRSGLPDDRIVYFGESLGSAVAVGLATERPPGGLILRSPFASLADVGSRAYPWLPVRRLLRDRFPAADWIAGYGGPTLVIVGARDTLIPPELSRRLTEAAPGPTDTLVVADAGHNDLALLDGDQMLAGIATFLREQVDLAVREPSPSD